MTIEVLKWFPRGPIAFAPIDKTVTPNRPGVFSALNCADTFSINQNVTYITHDSKCFAIAVEDKRNIKSFAATATMTLTDFTRENVIAALDAGSIAADVAPVAVLDEELTELPAAGGMIALGGANPNMNITALTIEDSGSPPTSLTPVTDYTLDAVNGMVTFGNVSGFVQPLKASYSYKNPVILAALAAGQLERWVQFQGINTVENNAPQQVNIFRAQFSPTKAFDLLPDDYGKLEIEVTLLADLSRPFTDPRGNFYTAASANW